MMKKISLILMSICFGILLCFRLTNDTKKDLKMSPEDIYQMEIDIINRNWRQSLQSIEKQQQKPVIHEGFDYKKAAEPPKFMLVSSNFFPKNDIQKGPVKLKGWKNREINLKNEEEYWKKYREYYQQKAVNLSKIRNYVVLNMKTQKRTCVADGFELDIAPGQVAFVRSDHFLYKSYAFINEPIGKDYITYIAIDDYDNVIVDDYRLLNIKSSLDSEGIKKFDEYCPDRVALKPLDDYLKSKFEYVTNPEEQQVEPNYNDDMSELNTDNAEVKESTYISEDDSTDSQSFKVKVPKGTIKVEEFSPIFKGVDMYFIPESETTKGISLPYVRMEVTDEGKLRILVWADKDSLDCSEIIYPNYEF